MLYGLAQASVGSFSFDRLVCIPVSIEYSAMYASFPSAAVLLINKAAIDKLSRLIARAATLGSLSLKSSGKPDTWARQFQRCKWV